MIPYIPGIHEDDFKVYDDDFLYETDKHLEPIAMLVQEERILQLRIRKCRLNTLDFLLAFPDLVGLDLHTSKVANWSEHVFQSMPNLQQVQLSGTGFPSAIRLSTLKQLDSIDLSDNQLTGLPKLPASITWLNVSGNILHTLEDLRTLKKLNTLLADGFQGRHLQGLEYLTNLKAIQLDGSPNLSDLSALKSLNLRQISFAQCNIENIELFAGHQELNYIDLNRNRIEHLEALNHLKQLRKLKVEGNAIASITPILTLTQLEVLLLKRNAIRTLPDLSPLTKLQEISLLSNPFVKESTDWKPIIRQFERRNIECDLYPFL